MTEFWLISAPGDKTCQQTFEKLNRATASIGLSTNFKFNIPDLKVGTLDVLVGLSDDLGKLDQYTESVTRKISQYLGDVLEDRNKLQENLMAENLDLVTYLTRFNWDPAKYPVKQSLKAIADIISKKVSIIEADLKMKATAYNNLKGSLQTLERKATGNLITRSLGDIVKKDDFVLQSDYLQTLLVVVPMSLKSEWSSKYESLSDTIVPRSSKILFEDEENCLCTVTMFAKSVDEFKHKCRENKFNVRDFVYNEEELEAGKTEINKLEADKKKQFGPLVKWLKVNFGECFSAWIHVKALRVFVESVLRYGLPVNFQAMLLQPQKKTMRKLREVLNNLYGHLGNADMAATDGQMDIPGLMMGNQEYFPYVYYRVNIDLVDSAA